VGSDLDIAAAMPGRNVLVTGGTGFVGLNLLRRLSAMGARVHVLTRPQSRLERVRDIGADLEVRVADLGDERSLAQVFDKSAPDFVFHLATPRGNDAMAWRRLTEFNVQAALHLTGQLMRAPQTRLVVAGSSLEYGPNAAPHRETDALSPVTWHGVGKAAADMIYGRAAATQALNINRLRLFHVYGPWESAHRLLPVAIRAAFSGRPVPFTASPIRRDWIYVEDVVDVLLAAAISPVQGEAFNIGSGAEFSNEDIVAAVEESTGRRIVLSHGAYQSSPSDAEHRCADIGKARMQLGWRPRHDLASGVAETIKWYRNRPDVWDGDETDKPHHV